MVRDLSDVPDLDRSCQVAFGRLGRCFGRSAVRRDDLQRLLVEHTDAWNRHDIDALMALFADDCVFEASAGSEFCGQRFVGRAEVRQAFDEVFASLPDAQWTEGRHFVIGDDYGVSEWRLRATRPDRSELDVLGCDFITTRDTTIVRKSSFRKHRPT
jgi:ketosteroid isomerase-like protein